MSQERRKERGNKKKGVKEGRKKANKERRKEDVIANGGSETKREKQWGLFLGGGGFKVLQINYHQKNGDREHRERIQSRKGRY